MNQDFEKKDITKYFYLFFIIIAFTFSAFSIITHYYLSVIQKVSFKYFDINKFLERNLGFFYYFTLQSNLLIFFIYLSLLLKIKKIKINYTEIKKLIKPSILSAACVYIIIVATVYNVILRRLYSPVGIQKIIDNFLHLINPALYIIFWLIFLDRENFYKKNYLYYSFKWIIYPLIYLFVVCFIGFFIRKFPYPFLNFYKIGFLSFILNIIFLILFFFFISFLVYIIGKINLNKTNSCKCGD